MANKGNANATLMSILAIILVIFGLAFLFKNFGLLPWGLWGTVWRMWPVLLVVLGIYMVLGRSRPGLATWLSLLAIVVAFGLTWASSRSGKNQSVTGNFSEPVGSLQKAEVDIQFGAGELVVDSLPNTSAELVQGEYEHQGLAQGVNKSFKTLDGIGRLELNAALAGQRILGDFRQKWQIGLTPRIPLDLSVKAGATQGQFNLTNLNLSRLRVDIGASKATINLPRVTSGTVDVQIKAGAADLTIKIPPGVAAQIKPDIGLASFNIDDERFPRTGEFYVSPGFASAGGRIRLEISSGLAKIEIK